MTTHKLSAPGVIATAMALLIFPTLLHEIFPSWFVAVPLGLLVAVLACRPVREGGAWLWERFS